MRNNKKIYIGRQVKYPLFFSDLNETWIFLTDFQKNTQMSNFMTVRLVRAELFIADGRMEPDTMKPTVTFRNYANASENC